MIFTAIRTAFMAILPKAIEQGFEYLTSDKPVTKNSYDKTRFTKKDVDIITGMWNAWQSNPSIYQNQDQFVAAVNTRFGTNKCKKAIITLIKKASV